MSTPKRSLRGVAADVDLDKVATRSRPKATTSQSPVSNLRSTRGSPSGTAKTEPGRRKPELGKRFKDDIPSKKSPAKRDVAQGGTISSGGPSSEAASKVRGRVHKSPRTGSRSEVYAERGESKTTDARSRKQSLDSAPPMHSLGRDGKDHKSRSVQTPDSSARRQSSRTRKLEDKALGTQLDVHQKRPPLVVKETMLGKKQTRTRQGTVLSDSDAVQPKKPDSPMEEDCSEGQRNPLSSTLVVSPAAEPTEPRRSGRARKSKSALELLGIKVKKEKQDDGYADAGGVSGADVMETTPKIVKTNVKKEDESSTKKRHVIVQRGDTGSPLSKGASPGKITVYTVPGGVRVDQGSDVMSLRDVNACPPGTSPSKSAAVSETQDPLAAGTYLEDMDCAHVEMIEVQLEESGVYLTQLEKTDGQSVPEGVQLDEDSVPATSEEHVEEVAGVEAAPEDMESIMVAVNDQARDVQGNSSAWDQACGMEPPHKKYRVDIPGEHGESHTFELGTGDEVHAGGMSIETIGSQEEVNTQDVVEIDTATMAVMEGIQVLAQAEPEDSLRPVGSPHGTSLEAVTQVNVPFANSDSRQDETNVPLAANAEYLLRVGLDGTVMIEQVGVNQGQKEVIQVLDPKASNCTNLPSTPILVLPKHLRPADRDKQAGSELSPEGTTEGSGGHLALKTLVELATAGVFGQNKTQESLTTGKEPDGEIQPLELSDKQVYQLSCDKPGASTYISITSKPPDTNRETAVYKTRSGRSVKVKQEADADEDVNPITSDDLGVLERNQNTGRFRPVKQIVMSRELQGMVDKLTPTDFMEKHIDVDKDMYGKKQQMRCRYCQVLIQDRHMFRRHIKEHPEVEFKPWSCPICGYLAQIKAQIARHINIHSRVKPYVCTECGRGFNFKQKLQLHLKYHQDIRDQHCPLCQISFHEFKTLKNHIIKIHNMDNPKELIRRHRPNMLKPTTDRGKASPKRPFKGQVKSQAQDSNSNAEGPGDADSSGSDAEHAPVAEAARETIKTEGNVDKPGLADAQDDQGDPQGSEKIIAGDVTVKKLQTPKVVMQMADLQDANAEIQGLLSAHKQKNGGKVTARHKMADSGSVTRRGAAGAGRDAAQAEPVADSVKDAKEEEEEEEMEEDGDDCLTEETHAAAARGDGGGDDSKISSVPGDQDTEAELSDAATPPEEGSQDAYPMVATAVKMDPESKEITPTQDTLEQDDNTSSTLAQGKTNKPPPVKHSRIYGCTKTGIITEKYKQGKIAFGVSHQTLREEYKRNKRKEEAGKAKLIKIEPSVGSVRRVKLANNQRITEWDQVEECLREYCVMLRWVAGTKVVFQCKMCDVMLSSKTQFARHLERDHPKVKAWKCQHCDYRCRLRSSYFVHTKMHEGIKKFVCDFCGKAFIFKQKLKIHMQSHNVIKDQKCSQCEKAFKNIHHLSKHMQRCHDPDRPKVCEVCGKDFKDNSQLKRHMDTHSDSKKYLCTLCNKYYRSKSSLQQHSKSHTCMFHCEICQKSFGSYSGFMAHKIMHDESYEGYVCKLCEKVLHTKGSLNRHTKIAHSSDRPFKCLQCSRSFKTKKDAKNHEVVHQSEKNFMCDICQFRCKRLESLRVHVRRHSAVKPYQCGVCGKQYTQKGALDIHLQHHSGTLPETCHICNKGFASKYQLQSHTKRRHLPQLQAEELDADSDKPMTVYMCEECNSVFLSQDNLAVHILAQHMNQSWVGGLGVKAPPVDGDDPGQVQEVEITMDGQSVILDGTPGHGHILKQEETIERVVTIDTPSGREGMVVTLVQPLDVGDEQRQQQQQEEEDMDQIHHQQHQQQFISSAMETVAESIDAMNAHEEGMLGPGVHLDPHAHEHEHEHVQDTGEVVTWVEEDGSQPVPEGADGDTFVAITDPNTNEEYMVPVNSSALETLFTVATAGEEEVETGMTPPTHQEHYVHSIEVPEIGEVLESHS